MSRQHRIDIRLLALLWGWMTGMAVPLSAAGLYLDPNTGIVPRIFSPNGDGINDVVFFNLDNPQLSAVSGVILDMSGGEIGVLVPAPGGIPTPDSLLWDGRDRNGHFVQPGPYLFRIEGEGKILSGVVAVAR